MSTATTTRKQLRSIIAKLQPPQLRPILLHFFTYLDRSITKAIEPLLDRLTQVEASNRTLRERIQELETSEAALRQVATISDERQRRTEHGMKEMASSIQRLTESLERNVKERERGSNKMETMMKDGLREIANNMNDQLRHEIHQLQTKVNSVEMEVVRINSMPPPPPPVPVLVVPPPAVAPPPAPPEQENVVQPPKRLKENVELLPRYELEAMVEFHVERGLGIGSFVYYIIFLFSLFINFFD